MAIGTKARSRAKVGRIASVVSPKEITSEQKNALRNAYGKRATRTQGMGSSARVNSRPLQQKSTRSIGMEEPTPRSAGSGYAKKLKTQELRGKSQISYKKPNTTTLSTPAMSNRIKTAVDKRDYATPETSFARKTRNKTLANRNNVSKYNRYR